MLLALGACSSAPVTVRSTGEDAAQAYEKEKNRLEKTNVISPGFTLRIRHSADESISGEFKVNFKGQLRLPFKVALRAAGLTTDELAAKLVAAYAPYFKVKNNVSVDIAGREYIIEVRGLVEKPGQYAIKLDTSLEEIISMSGGLPSGADAEGKTAGKPEWVRIVRPVFRGDAESTTVRWVRLTDYFLRYDVRNEVLWRGGEQLFFQITGDPDALKTARSQTLQIMGEVHKPGEYPLQSGADLYAYLASAGGPTGTADLGSVLLVHKARDTSSTVDLTKGTAIVDMDAGDVIMVKSTQGRAGFFERVGPTLISLGTLVVSTLLLIITL
jgi:protein involved in polysaccharide export with SLBB domain